MLPFICKFIAIGMTGVLLGFGTATGAEIKVMLSGGFSGAYGALVPEFERASGHKIVTVRGASMGNTPEAVPNRIARGEPVDVVIVNTEAIDRLVSEGKLVAAGRVELARALIGAVVRAGTPKPDIKTVAAFKETLLKAKSIAYSGSASGIYLTTVLFPRLGVAEQVKDKSRMFFGGVAHAVARGECELGLQTISEMLMTKGVDHLGPIPAEIQEVQSFSAAIAAGAKEPAAGLALIKYLSSPQAAPAITKAGMVPVTPAGKR